MNEKNNDFINKTINMYKHLFPNAKLHDEITNINAQSFRISLKVILRGITTMFLLTVILLLFLPESIRYIILTVLCYLVLSLLTINLLVINKTKKAIFKIQINELNLANNNNSKSLLLHKKYKKYHLKWNVIYIIIITIAVYMSLSLFINDIISTGNTTIAPILVLFLVMLIFVIPTIIINIFSWIKLINKQNEIIDKEN